MLLLPNTHVDWIVHRWSRLLVGGALLIGMAVALPPAWRCGALTGYTLMSLGVYAMVLRKWRADPGLWMLAGLLVVTLTPSAAYFEYQQWHGILVPPPAQNPPVPKAGNAFVLGIDAAIALFLLTKSVRFALTVAISNWRYTRRPPLTAE